MRPLRERIEDDKSKRLKTIYFIQDEDFKHGEKFYANFFDQLQEMLEELDEKIDKKRKARKNSFNIFLEKLSSTPRP